MKKILFALHLIIGLTIFSQNVLAQYELKQADGQFNLFNYSKAVDFYLKAYKKKETLYAAEHIAACYNFMLDYDNTETWYAIAVQLKGALPDDILKYAKALQNNAKYNEAKAQFIKYYRLSSDAEKEKVKMLITSCDSSMLWMKNPIAIDIKNEQELNSPKSDWGAVNYKHSIVFSSDRKNNLQENNSKKKPFLRFDNQDVPDKNRYGWTGNNYLDLYIREKSTNTNDTVGLFPFNPGTDYHVASASFTKDQNEMYFTVTRVPKKWKTDTAKIRTFNLEIFSCRRDSITNKWGTPIPFKYNNAEKWSVGDPFISPDGKMLYFTADFSWGLGGTDIYYCTKDEYGEWNKPINLTEVNTPGNERTPVLDSRGNLYFSSDGSIGMGGLDIFRAMKTRHGFKPKQNMGYPINSSRDDFAFVLNDDATGYLASNRMGGVGEDDIYSFTQQTNDIFASGAPIHFALEGVVYDKTTKKPVANSVVTLNRILALEQAIETDASGKYIFDLIPNMDFNLSAEKPGYLLDKETVTTKGLRVSQVLKKNFYLQKYELNKPIRIENIYYDFDKSNIRRDAAVELNKLIKIMKDNPDIKIELGSHTDSRGDDDYNMRLSQARANSVVNYLIKVGRINKDRLTARGYGETLLLNRCTNGVDCSAAEHQLNRRTEFKIVEE